MDFHHIIIIHIFLLSGTTTTHISNQTHKSSSKKEILNPSQGSEGGWRTEVECGAGEQRSGGGWGLPNSTE